MNFYELQEPTSWVDPPTTWSSTSVDEVQACPRRWQLLHSQWGPFERFPVRPHPASIEGQIVHDALDRLTRACGRRGGPAFGSAEFAQALRDADFFPSFARAVSEWQQRLASHPRASPGFRLRASSEELANRAVRMFREQYQPAADRTQVASERGVGAPAELGKLLRSKGALSEVKLVHPRLPFMGVLDRIQIVKGTIEVVDFKTGKPSERHRMQLLRYALLWWRATGESPGIVTAQYLNAFESWPVATHTLEEVELKLAETLPQLSTALSSRPAVAQPSNSCPACPARARCSPGWNMVEPAAPADGHGDAELVMTGKAGNHGFISRTRSGSEVAVVFEAPIAKLWPECVEGRTVRVLGGVWKEKRGQLELKAWTEVFVLSPG